MIPRSVGRTRTILKLPRASAKWEPRTTLTVWPGLNLFCGNGWPFPLLSGASGGRGVSMRGTSVDQLQGCGSRLPVEATQNLVPNLLTRLQRLLAGEFDGEAVDWHVRSAIGWLDIS